MVRLLASVLERNPDSPAKWRPELPSALCRVVLRCLEKDPERRYASAKDLAADLRKLKKDSERALDATSPQTTPVSVVPSGSGEPQAMTSEGATDHKARFRWVVVLGVVAMLALGGWVFLGRAHKERVETIDKLLKQLEEAFKKAQDEAQKYWDRFLEAERRVARRIDSDGVSPAAGQTDR